MASSSRLQTVMIQGQVTGTIQQIGFQEGDDVQAGQMLFQLDPRPFEAALRQAEAALARDEGHCRERAARGGALQDARRKRLRHEVAGRSAASAATAATATVQASRAAVENARINLSYATIRAPIAGRTGRVLVKAGQPREGERGSARRHQHVTSDPRPLPGRRSAISRRCNDACAKGSVPVRVTTPTAATSPRRARWRSSTTRSIR